MKFIVLLIAVAFVKSFDPALAEDIYQYSRMAYCKEDKIYEWDAVAAKRHPNVKEIQVFTNSTHEAQGYCAYDPEYNRVIISIRGSDNLKNWIQNLNLFHTKYNKCKGCKVHHGFKNVYENLANNLVGCAYYLTTNYPDAALIVTGHSLGAAQATLAALEINEYIKKVDFFYIYGSPRVGNKKFVEYTEKQFELSQTLVARITHAKDPFIHLPTTWMGYKHLGYEYFLPGDSYQDYKICYREDKGCAHKYDWPWQWKIKDHLFYYGQCAGCSDEGCDKYLF